jgi:ATP-dependent DNA helicase RecG
LSFPSKEKFFEGYSIPRNKEIMRIYKDLELVEHLGSGVPRILESYSKECFKFTDNFLRMRFPSDFAIQNTGGPIGGPIELTIRQKEILQIIKNNNKISKRNLALLLNINVSATQERLDILKEKGCLERIDGTRGYWKVNLR